MDNLDDVSSFVFDSYNINNLDSNENNFLNVLSNNKDININVNNIDNNPELNSNNYIYTLSLKISNFESEKELNKFVKKVKQTIRSSYEYRLWVDYIKNILLCNSCAFTGENTMELTVEIHHHPILLEDIVLSVISKKIDNNDKFSSFDISSEIIYLHYNMKVGVVPLITSLHEKYHNGFLEIPIDYCIGDWKYLLQNYNFTDEQLKDIKRKETITSKNYQFSWKK